MESSPVVAVGVLDLDNHVVYVYVSCNMATKPTQQLVEREKIATVLYLTRTQTRKTQRSFTLTLRPTLGSPGYSTSWFYQSTAYRFFFS